jgi:hypothetical protein
MITGAELIALALGQTEEKRESAQDFGSAGTSPREITSLGEITAVHT